MAVVTRYLNSVRDPNSTTQDRIPAELSQGHIKKSGGTVELVNGDSANSKVLVASWPSNSRIDPDSKLFFDAIAGNTKARLGTELDDDCLMAETDVSAGGSFSAVGNVNIANYDKALWELQGSATDPGGKIDIYMTIKNALTAGGTFTSSLKQITP